MFTGIIECVGKVVESTENADGLRFKVEATGFTDKFVLGESISIDGACHTVIAFTDTTFVVESTHETLRRTSLGSLKVGSRVNLEKAMRMSDRLGGHMVSGHVDATGVVKSIEQEGFSKVITFELDAALAPFFVEKGSACVSGVSLTVVDFPDDNFAPGEKFSFRVALIPHTMDVTTFGELKVGDPVNIETDIVARYVERWLTPGLRTKLGIAHGQLPELITS